MGNGQEALDTVTSSAVDTAAAVEPSDDSTLTRVRSVLAGLTSRPVVGWVLLVGWLLWLVAAWVTQPRLVPQDLLADDLGQGRVTAYSVVVVDEEPGSGSWSPYRLDVAPASLGDGGEDGAGSGRPVTVAYWVDAPVARLRVVDANGPSSTTPAEVVQRLESAGVPEAAPATFSGGLPSDRVDNAHAVLLLVTTLVVILGPRPRRGTRWFWFWVVGGPLSVGVPIFAVAELLRPRFELPGTAHPGGVAGRWSGLAGFAAAMVLSLVGVGVLMALRSAAPLWVLRG